MGSFIDLKLFDLINARPVAAGLIPVDGDRISVAELIRRRVETEVARHNAGATERYRSLVTLEAIPQGQPVDPEAQVTRALDSFQANGFFILVGNHQCETLSEEIAVTDTTEVCFLKLVTLVGG